MRLVGVDGTTATAASAAAKPTRQRGAKTTAPSPLATSDYRTAIYCVAAAFYLGWPFILIAALPLALDCLVSYGLFASITAGAAVSLLVLLLASSSTRTCTAASSSPSSTSYYTTRARVMARARSSMVPSHGITTSSTSLSISTRCFPPRSSRRPSSSYTRPHQHHHHNNAALQEERRRS